MKPNKILPMIDLAIFAATASVYGRTAYADIRQETLLYKWEPLLEPEMRFRKTMWGDTQLCSNDPKLGKTRPQCIEQGGSLSNEL
jgi:hypothetical protein